MTKVGIGLAVFRANPKTGIRQVLLGKRMGSHGAGEWAFPGGHMEPLESFETTAKRELMEEVGPDFKVEDFSVVSVINLVEYAPKHYIDIGMQCWWVSGEPKIMEPNKCEFWEWFDVNNLPENKFSTVDRILSSALMDNTPGLTIVWDVSNG